MKVNIYGNSIIPGTAINAPIMNYNTDAKTIRRIVNYKQFRVALSATNELITVDNIDTMLEKANAIEFKETVEKVNADIKIETPKKEIKKENKTVKKEPVVETVTEEIVETVTEETVEEPVVETVTESIDITDDDTVEKEFDYNATDVKDDTVTEEVVEFKSSYKKNKKRK